MCGRMTDLWPKQKNCIVCDCVMMMNLCHHNATMGPLLYSVNSTQDFVTTTNKIVSHRIVINRSTDDTCEFTHNQSIRFSFQPLLGEMLVHNLMIDRNQTKRSENKDTQPV